MAVPLRPGKPEQSIHPVRVVGLLAGGFMKPNYVGEKSRSRRRGAILTLIVLAAVLMVPSAIQVRSLHGFFAKTATLFAQHDDTLSTTYR